MLKPPSFQRSNLSLALILGGFVSLLICYLLFFSTPFLNSSMPRWGLFLMPTIEPNFVNDIWFGVDLPLKPYAGERFTSFVLGVFVIFVAFCLGHLLLCILPKGEINNTIETCFFSSGIGLILLSTLTFIMGHTGRGSRPILPFFTGILLLWGVSIFTKAFHNRRFSKRSQRASNWNSFITRLKSYIFPHNSSKLDQFIVFSLFILLCLFSAFYLFAATQPIFEYDAVEYHLQGAREIFETGSITFSSHNVYTNMPLGAEMFYLIGFNLVRDLGFSSLDVLRIGSLVGKTVLTSFAFLTCAGLVSFSRRFLNNTSVGLWAAFAFLSFPGVFEVYVSGLNDCVLSFCILGIFYLLYHRILSEPSERSIGGTFRYSCLLGSFVGFAIAVKYTSIVFILFPTVFFILLIEFHHARFNRLLLPPSSQSSRTPSNKFLNTVCVLGIFTLVTLIIGGGWYFRNALDTGNPVYPLGYTIFGDSTGLWNDSINMRWRHAHSSTLYGGVAFINAISSSLWRDGMCSPFFTIIALSGVFVLVFRKQSFETSIFTYSNVKLIRAVFFLVFLYWIGWFFFTHRLTRFLLPIGSLSALLFGVLVSQMFQMKTTTKSACLVAVLLGALYSGLTIDMLGQGRMAPLQALEEDPCRFTKESIYFNNHPELFISQDEEQKLLLIGEAKAFMYRIPLLYSTCWNDSPLISILSDAVEKDDNGNIVAINNVKKIVENFESQKVVLILVDFSELSRFRSEGNYGFNNPEISPQLFQLLLDEHIIEPFEFDAEYNEKYRSESHSTQVFKIVKRS